MIDSNQFHTVVFKNLTDTEREKLIYHDKFSAGSYSHALNDRDGLLSALAYAEAALADIGDAEREEGDDLQWCEERAAQALPRIRYLLKAHGHYSRVLP
jgi:hypothetical protein